MIHIAHNPKDCRYIFLWGDNISANTNAQKRMGRASLETYMNMIPAYQFMPSYTGIPRPEVFLNKFKKGDRVIYYCFAGLLKTIVDWCAKNHIDFVFETEISDLKYRKMDLTLEEFIKMVDSWGMSIKPREYQYKAAWLILKYRFSMSQLATRAGKTLIAYMVFRYMIEHGANNILMIVPNTTLVKQGVQDMSAYKEFFKTETVWSKGEMCESSNLTIGTFQSLIKKLDKKSPRYDPKFFNKFDVICCDECHTAKCVSIKQLLSQEFIKNVDLRFGFSGTVPEDGTIDGFSCRSLLGPTIQDIRSSELVDEGFLAKVDATQVLVEYKLNETLMDEYIRCGEYLVGNTITDEYKKEVMLPKEQQDFTMKYAKKLPYAVQQVKQMYTKEEYMDYLVDCCKANGANLLMLEQMVIHHSKKRVKAIDSIVKSADKNIIVFAHHTEYLRFLKEHFTKEFPDRKVYIITGTVSEKKRGEIIKELENNNNCILCASYACCGTGLTFKNLYYGILAQSFKSKTINLQSIGRGMLKSKDKDVFYLYDIVDMLPTGKLAEQGRVKNKLFKKENYEVHIKKAV